MTGPESPWATARQIVQRFSGVEVMPLRPLTKCPWKGMGWDRIRTNDLETVAAYGRDLPGSNYAVLCGGRVSVIDIDVKNGVDGLRSYLDLCKWLDVEPPVGLTVRTPNGGLHLYTATVLPTVTGWLPGVDVRGIGGYVVGPGSVLSMPLGVDFKMKRREAPSVLVRYEFIDREQPLAVLPDVLVESIRHDRLGTSGGVTGSGMARSDLPATEWFLAHGFRVGQRNSDCHRLACRMVGVGRPLPEVIGWIRAVWNRTEQSDQPFPWGEAVECIKSAERAVGQQYATDRGLARGVLSGWSG